MNYHKFKENQNHVPIMEMPINWTNFLDGVDDAEFESFIGLVDHFTGRNIIPRPKQILQLLAIIIDPSQCLRLTSKSPAHQTDPLIAGPIKTASNAFAYLTSLMRVAGSDSILRCLPGYDLDSEITIDMEKDLRIPNFRNLTTDEMISFTGEIESPLLSIVTQISNEKNLWSLLFEIGSSSSSSESSSRINQTSSNRHHLDLKISPGAWDLLGVLTLAWELDYQLDLSELKPLKLKNIDDYSMLLYSPHLLRQFPKGPGESRPIDSRLIKIIFSPFSPAAASETCVWGHIVNSREEARKVSIRLLGLLQDLDASGKLDQGSLIQEMSSYMMTISDLPTLQTFINRLPAHHPKFNASLTLAFFVAITRSKPVLKAGLTRTDSQTSLLSRDLSSVISSSSTLRRNISQTRLTFGAVDHSDSSKSFDFPSLDYLTSDVFSRMPMEMVTIEKSNLRSSHQLSKQTFAELEIRYRTVLLTLLSYVRSVFLFPSNHHSIQSHEANQWKKAMKEGKVWKVLMEANVTMLTFEGSCMSDSHDEWDENLKKELDLCRKRFERCLGNLDIPA
ncbi:hypothetical protein DFH28DRAFT_1056439 [Melampsora americana]|nr:hypothetical protein DFH28DRAFT_1056439 [Melampsora americana]